MASSSNQEPLIRSLQNVDEYKKCIVYIMEGRCAIILNNSSPIVEETFRRNYSLLAKVSQNMLTSDLYYNRLKTFHIERNPWRLDFITPRRMARAGFYYTGEQDRVKCMHCSRTFDSWCPGDDPIVEHKRYSPWCPFFTAYKGKFNKTSICYTFVFPTFAVPFICEQ